MSRSEKKGKTKSVEKKKRKKKKWTCSRIKMTLRKYVLNKIGDLVI